VQILALLITNHVTYTNDTLMNNEALHKSRYRVGGADWETLGVSLQSPEVSAFCACFWSLFWSFWTAQLHLGDGSLRTPFTSWGTSCNTTAPGGTLYLVIGTCQ